MLLKAGKKKAGKSRRSKSTTSTQSKSKGEKSKRPKSSSPAEKKREPVDILSPVAMINAYYICHDAIDCLDKRGFKWEGAKKKKKKK